MRDFKKFTSKKIIQTISEEPESRREWLLDNLKNLANIYPDRNRIKSGKTVIMRKKFSQTDG